MKIAVDKDDLTNVLLLLIANDHLSAHRAGLEERQKNRKTVIRALLFMLGLTKEEADDLFFKRD